ncbi:MAG: phosphomannomutase/phosphoglucomutase [Bacteroidota bacterium]|nr:phosphomannomutase/phosphoglucomutase [Bacteroidota bacterium]
MKSTPFNWLQLQNGSDIRGIAMPGVPGEEVNLTPERSYILAQSFVQWLRKDDATDNRTLTISIGTDPRLSGPMLKEAFINGLIDVGCRVLDFGLASTPAMFMSTVDKKTSCDGAVMLTASHLPFNRNGMKFFTADGGLDKGGIGEILGIRDSGLGTRGLGTRDLGLGARGTVEVLDFISVYSGILVDYIRSAVNHPVDFDKPLAGQKIIVDAGNGAGGFFATKILEPLGADITGSQFLDPDGTFPNHSPNPENPAAMKAIQEAVIRNKADLGIIFDTDVDRAAIVDESGSEINRNRLIALISSIVLEEHPDSWVVTDSITSDGLNSFIQNELKGYHHRFKRGYKNVINEAIRLNETGKPSWLAIETSGHAALKENYFLDDGAFLIAKILVKFAQLKMTSGRSIGSLLDKLEEPTESKEYRIKIQAADFKEIGETVIEELKQLTEKTAGWSLIEPNHEGIRVSCDKEHGNGWFLLRLSLHDPVMPLNIESEISGGVETIYGRLSSFLSNYPDLKLP